MAGHEGTKLKENKKSTKKCSKKALEMLKQAGIPTDGTCLYCQTGKMDELQAGRLLEDKASGITVHHYCLLFASGLSQRGREHQGIEGFLSEDIIQEFRRAKRLICRYCMNKGATIGCVIKRCQMTFHFHCGLVNGALSQFFGNFNSFCYEHRPSQESDPCCGSPSKGVCPICFSDVPTEPQVNILKTPCCKNLWLHRQCLQRQAISSGYFFRCPICNNKKEFEEEMKKFGIYIPEQDASWEREDGAFQDLLERHHRCDAEDCLCPKGRTFSEGKRWLIMLCDICGSQGCHIKCGGLKNQSKDWACWICRTMVGSEMESKKKLKSTATLSKKQLNGPPYKMKLQGKTARSQLPSNKLLKSSNSIPAVSVPTDQGSPVARRAAGVSLPDVSLKPLSWQEITEHECENQLLVFSQIRKSSRTSCRLELPPMIYNELDELANIRKRALEDSESESPPVIEKMPKRLCLAFPPMKEDQQQKTPFRTKLIQTKLVSKANDNEISKRSAMQMVGACSESTSNDLPEVDVQTPSSIEVIIISSDDDSPVHMCDVKSSPKVSTSGHLCKRHQREAFDLIGNDSPLAKKAKSCHLSDDVIVCSYQDSGRIGMEGDDSSLSGRVTKSATVFEHFDSVRMSSDIGKSDILWSEESDEASPLNIKKTVDMLKKTTKSMCIRDSHSGTSGLKVRKRGHPLSRKGKKEKKSKGHNRSKSADKNRFIQSSLTQYFRSSSSSGLGSPLKIRSSPRFQPSDERTTRSGKWKGHGRNTDKFLNLKLSSGKKKKKTYKKKSKKRKKDGHSTFQPSDTRTTRSYNLKVHEWNTDGFLNIKFSSGKKKKKTNKKKSKRRKINEKNASVMSNSNPEKSGRPKKVKRGRKSKDSERNRNGTVIGNCLVKHLNQSTNLMDDGPLVMKACASEISLLSGEGSMKAGNIVTRLKFDDDDNEKDKNTINYQSKHIKYNKHQDICRRDHQLYRDNSHMLKSNDHQMSIESNESYPSKIPSSKLEESHIAEIVDLYSFSEDGVSANTQSQRTPEEHTIPQHTPRFISQSLTKYNCEQRMTTPSTSRSELKCGRSLPRCTSNGYHASVSHHRQFATSSFRSSEVRYLRKRLKMEDLEVC